MLHISCSASKIDGPRNVAQSLPHPLSHARPPRAAGGPDKAVPLRSQGRRFPHYCVRFGGFVGRHHLRGVRMNAFGLFVVIVAIFGAFLLGWLAHRVIRG
jgi:hypothetical protein